MFQKSVLAAAALAAAVLSPAAMAAEGFTYKVYGKIDAFVEHDSGGQDGSRLSVESGGMNGTRWGVKGDADLGSVAPGLKAIYQLEGGIFVNNGRQAQGGRLFGRQAYAGVTGKFGTLTAGRQYTPMNNLSGDFDPFGLGYGSPLNDGVVPFGVDSRYDNAIMYATPDMAGLQGTLFVAPTGKTGHPGQGGSGLSLTYGAGPFSAGVAYQKDDHAGYADGKVDNLYVAAAYKLGSVKLMGGYGSAKAKADAGGELRRNGWLAGAVADVTRTGQLWLVYGSGKTKDSSPSDKAQVVSAAWMESITPALRVYGVLSLHKNDDGSALVPQGTSSYGAYSVRNGDNARGLALGFQYDF